MIEADPLRRRQNCGRLDRPTSTGRARRQGGASRCRCRAKGVVIHIKTSKAWVNLTTHRFRKCQTLSNHPHNFVQYQLPLEPLDHHCIVIPLTPFVFRSTSLLIYDPWHAYTGHLLDAELLSVVYINGSRMIGAMGKYTMCVILYVNTYSLIVSCRRSIIMLAIVLPWDDVVRS